MSLLEHKHYLNSEDNEEEKEEKELEQPNRELAPWQAPTPSTSSTELKKTKRELTPEEIAEKEEERKSRKKEIVMIVIGTFISLVLTQLLANILINVQRAQNRRMSAMMVLSNVENFARMLDGHSEAMARNDTVAMWLLTQPLAYLDTMPAEELDKLTNEALSLRFLNRDHTAENIFESSIDTWDNMGNVKFIDMVGQCFSQMNSVEEFWNDWVTETKALGNEISGHSENYPGTTFPSKYLHNDEMRHRILRVHDWRG